MRQDYTADPIVTVTEVTKRDAFSATETNVRFCIIATRNFYGR